MGIIVTDDRVVTICRHEHYLLRDLPHEHQIDLSTTKPARFVLHLLWSVANNYLVHLNEIKMKCGSQFAVACEASFKPGGNPVM